MSHPHSLPLGAGAPLLRREVPENRVADELALRRHERKYLLGEQEASRVELQLAARPDCEIGPTVRILTFYLDREDASLARRLQAGRGARSRLRIRIYDGATERIAVERKYQRGSLVRKQRILCSPSELRPLLEGRDPRHRRLGIGRLVPAPIALCAVAYERRVLRDPAGTFRCSIDRALGAIRVGPGWLEELEAGRLPEVPPHVGAPVVVECKYGGQVPEEIASALDPHAAPGFSKLTWSCLQLGWFRDT